MPTITVTRKLSSLIFIWASLIFATPSNAQITNVQGLPQNFDLAAPGVNIQVAKPGKGKKYGSGTSFSAPYVSAALLILKRRKNLRSHNGRIQWFKREYP